MKAIHFLRGLPASGKTTWAKEKLASLNGRGEICAIRTNKDEIRDQLRSEGRKTESAVIRRETELVVDGLKAGFEIIIDNTHLHPKHELRYRQLAREYGYCFEVVSFMHVSVRDCIDRDSSRPNPIGEGVIRRMHSEYKNRI